MLEKILSEFGLPVEFIKKTHHASHLIFITSLWVCFDDGKTVFFIKSDREKKFECVGELWGKFILSYLLSISLLFIIAGELQ